MKLEEIVKKAHAFSEPFRVTGGDGFRLKSVDSEGTLEEARRHLGGPRRPSPNEAA